MEPTLISFARNRDHAGQIIKSLEGAGIGKVYLLLHQEEGEAASDEANLRSPEDDTTTEGAGKGAAAGGVAGGLAAAAALAIPPLQPLIVTAPLAAATGAAIGAATGAAGSKHAGGGIHSLADLGLPAEQLTSYEGRIQAGECLVAARAAEGESLETGKNKMEQAGATDVQIVDD